MPFDSNGKYSLPPIYKATTGEKVLAEQHNTPLEDIAQALSQCLKRDGSTPAIRNLSMSGFLVTNLGDAKNPGDAVNKKLLDAAVPIGSIQAFVGDTPPAGWDWAWGQARSRTAYAALFAVIGTKFGAGDGGSTFNYPDLRGRVLVGRDDMGGPAANRVTAAGSGISGNALGASGGAQNVTLNIAQLPWHNHGGATTGAGGHDHEVSLVGGPDSDHANNPTLGSNGTFRVWSRRTSWVSDHAHGIYPEGGGQAHTNMQPSIIVNFIIRTGV
ncbi:tail fiber protein [Brucella pituitosa]|uniref:phage tail protein n=1 Tax=Brucella pituitosa TaxID=571256 RepID=UPI002002D636|nr:tail fiber protein [Brucella pituitosa]MCK4207203.1 tail fiber protein [Brucella pituitosa]